MNHRADSPPATSTDDPVLFGIAAPGYRLPSATRLGGVTLQIADVSRSLEYYQQVLGFRMLHREEGAATLGARGEDTVLVQLTQHANARPVPRRGRLGLYHFAILLPDRGSLGRFIAHLGALGVRAGMSDHLVSEAIYLTDPDGLGIEVYADRPRSAWRHNGRELLMATEPLDAESLVQAASGAAWTGMPSGTTIGHVHLHVGDLDTASAFFHAALGFDKVVWSYPGALFLSAGGYHHHLGTNIWAAGATRPDKGDARLLEWEIVLPRHDDVEAAARSLTAAGHVAESVGRDRLADDPWGTTLRLRAG